MLKFIRQYADKLDGVQIYPIISLVIFVLFFAGMLIYVKRMNKKQVDELSQMPLDTSDQPNQQPTNS